jgi:c-di-GMP-binding flagellar brake protein YcgR
MDTTTNQEKLIKPRISVTLKATVSFAGRETEEQQALISNLSATGARLHLGKAAPLSAGMGITLKIFIPNTVLHCAAEGEILWVSRQHNAVSLGVKFKEFFSEFMLQQLIKI